MYTHTHHAHAREKLRGCKQRGVPHLRGAELQPHGGSSGSYLLHDSHSPNHDPELTGTERNHNHRSKGK